MCNTKNSYSVYHFCEPAVCNLGNVNLKRVWTFDKSLINNVQICVFLPSTVHAFDGILMRM